MTKYYAQLTEAFYVHSVVTSPEPLETGEYCLELGGPDTSLVGKIYNPTASGQQGKPVFDTPEPATPVWEWYIDIGPFMDRFRGAKVPVLTSTDPTVRALIQDLQMRKWIDLKRVDVAEALAYIRTKVPTLSSQLVTEILTTPVTELENVALRRLYF